MMDGFVTGCLAPSRGMIWKTLFEKIDHYLQEGVTLWRVAKAKFRISFHFSKIRRQNEKTSVGVRNGNVIQYHGHGN
jgi:hypothetical protein